MTARGQAIERTDIGLTFDDAFRELLTHAVPVLERFGFGATVYVPTAYIGGTSRWLDEAAKRTGRCSAQSELRELPGLRIECGAHSHTHPALDELDLESHASRSS